MTNNKGTKRKRMATGEPETSQPNKKQWKRRLPNFSTPTEMVTFFIGKEGSDEKFFVHKEYACYHSPVLRAAFNSNFIEGVTQTYRLEDTNPSAFRLLVQWFYKKEFDIFEQDDLECPNDEKDPEIEKLWAAQDLELVQLWVIADKLLIRPLQNAVIDILEDSWEQPFVRPGGPTTSWVQYVYDYTSVGSPLRNFAVDVCAYEVGAERFAEAADDFPKDVLLDVAILLSEAIQTIAPDDHDNAAGEKEAKTANNNDRFAGHTFYGFPARSAFSHDVPARGLSNNDLPARSLFGNPGVREESEDSDESSSESSIDNSSLPRYKLIRKWRGYHIPEDE